MEYLDTDTMVSTMVDAYKGVQVRVFNINIYRIYPAIRRGFCPCRMTSNNQISPMKFCYNTNFYPS